MARGFSSVCLLASTDGISYTVLASGMLGNSYLASYGYWGILVEATFAPTTAQYFRFEGTRATPFGPRIVELDGLQPVPEPSSLVSAALGMAALAGYAGWRRERRRVVG
jgi:MYXO-CTERM domain-containing protein